MLKQKNIIITIIIAGLSALPVFSEPVDVTEAMKESLVYIEVSSVGWEQIQPWRQTSVATVGTYGTAVGPNKVLAVARPLANAVSVQARRYGQNEYIPAKIKIIDYEYNLCLIELDAAALSVPLTPLLFDDNYIKNKDLRAYWLSSGGHLTSARATLDRAEVMYGSGSFEPSLHFILTNPSRSTGSGEVYCLNGKPIGIAALGSDAEVGVIPTETINRFLEEAARDDYAGFGAVGFETTHLLDPAVRSWLDMPDDRRHGVYVSSVYAMGTGSSELAPADVILAVGDHSINPYGRYLHDRYDRIGLNHRIGSARVGQTLPFTLWRDGEEVVVDVLIRNIESRNMLVPHYEYDHRPEYMVIGGFVFQKLTRDYMTMWGDGWQGKVPPHLFYYYRNHGFNPTPERRQVVILSYVLPTEINLGYHGLGRLVVKSFNGKEIGSMQELAKALVSNPDSPYHVVEFELDSPAVVIDKEILSATNQHVMQQYGIQRMSYIRTE